MKRLTALLLLLSATVLIASPGDIYIEQDQGINYMQQKMLKMPNMVSQQTSVPIVAHFSVTTAQLAAIGAATSGDILLTTLPAKSAVLTTLVKHSEAVVGASVSASTARVITANTNYGTAFNIFQAPGATVSDFYATPKIENYATTTALNLHVTTTGANLSVVTAGAVDVWVTYYIMP